MTTKKKTTDKYVLIRSNMSGVWMGKLVKKTGNEVQLKEALKIWRWKGANTTSELAVQGCDGNGFSRVANPTDVIVLDVCEIHSSNESAYIRTRKAGWN